MCHIVNGQRGYFLEFDDFLIGIKGFNYDDGALRSVFDDKKYFYKLSKVGKNIICQDKYTRQMVSFEINVINDWFEKVSHFSMVNLPGGMHISPFIKGNKISGHKKIFVAFDKRDVVFYDGRDVSVLRFIILNPKKMEEIVTYYRELIKGYHLPFWGDDKMWLKDYETFFDSVKEKLKTKNIKGRKTLTKK